MARPEAPISRITARAFQVATDAPESDGTFAWHATTAVVVQVEANGKRGLGWTYGTSGVREIVRDLFASELKGLDAMDVPCAYETMHAKLRNVGQPGVGATAVSAVDSALWDLKARILDRPLALVLGRQRSTVPVYGSGGFTSYTIEKLQEQLGTWAKQGIPRVKMKVGREPAKDPERVKAAREAIGRGVQLFVDANGAYSRQQALAMAEVFRDFGVVWFEEPVSSNDLAGLRHLCARAPAGMEIAAGEYAWDVRDARAMLEAGAVQVLQADVTRCGGITGFLRIAALCEAFETPMSAHCAPSLHVAACCAAPKLRHLEYFHDHVRLERMLFDGTLEPEGGELRPDLSRPGNGLSLKESEAARFEI